MSVVLRLVGAGSALTVISIGQPAGAQVPLSARALSPSDLPAEYSKVESVPSLFSPCVELYIPAQGPRVLIGFSSPLAATFEEGLVQLRQPSRARAVFNDLKQHYSSCHSVHPLVDFNVSGSGGQMSLPKVGDQSQAFGYSLKVNHLPVHTEMILFRQGAVCGEVNYVGSAPVDRSQMDAVASKAIQKLLVNTG